MKNDTNYTSSAKRILTTENRTCAIRPTAIQSHILKYKIHMSGANKLS